MNSPTWIPAASLKSGYSYNRPSHDINGRCPSSMPAEFEALGVLGFIEQGGQISVPYMWKKPDIKFSEHTGSYAEED